MTTKTATCNVCGQQFEYEHDGRGRLRRFCDEHKPTHKGYSMSEQRVCQMCGNTFEGPYNAKVCAECRPLWISERSKASAKALRKLRAGTGFTLAREVPAEKKCCRCGEVKPASEFCRAKDRPDGLQSHCRQCQRDLTREYHATHREEIRERDRAKRPVRERRQCAICGETFTPRCIDQELCGKRECRLEDTRRRSRELSAAKKPLKQRKCKECGKVFVPEYGNKRRAFDTEECMAKYGSRVGKATRRARLRGAGTVEAIDPLYILKRDGYRCYLCGCKTPKSLRGTILPNAPEIDHVVPIAKGGTHTEANLRCVCRSCNINKSDRLLEEIESDGVQLRLL